MFVNYGSRLGQPFQPSASNLNASSQVFVPRPQAQNQIRSFELTQAEENFAQEAWEEMQEEQDEVHVSVISGQKFVFTDTAVSNNRDRRLQNAYGFYAYHVSVNSRK